MALTAVVVRVRLGRPVVFRQVRTGYRGVPFVLFKFRTMHPAGHDGEPDADRMPSIGRILRSLSVDELASLWNVARGEMNLVGPRPLLPRYLDLYTTEQRRRLDARPGVTGLAQVSGRNSLSWPDRLALDVWYVDHRSPRLDLAILVRTVRIVIQRSGVSEPGAATMTPFDEWKPPHGES